MKRPSLPIHTIIPALQQQLRQQTLVLLTAEPGAGKTTQVPLALLQENWLMPQSIIMLEPRRLAARAAARRMADLLDESVGMTVGYRTRVDTRIGPNTRLEVVTDGILTRMLQHDPGLTRYGMIIFDEFHERSLQADLSLALALQAQSLFREDLRLLIMSATLDIHTLIPPLKQAPLLTAEGRTFPIETRYVGPVESRTFARQVAGIIHRVLLTEPGNMLVFLPGASEIHRVNQQLLDVSLPPHMLIAPLHGDLSPLEQDQAILPPPAGWRKVVLSTNIAETSLTIEGIRIVLDTGLMRVPRFDSRSGMSRLTTVQVSRASADQRRGRAGRLEPGLCLRCWPEIAHRTLTPRTSPEILDADLTPLALELAVWGVRNSTELFWLDPPPLNALAQARRLLQDLGALDHNDQMTEHGRKMAGLPVHPRLAHMMIQGDQMRLGPLACDLAALLSERELLKGLTSADLRNRMEEYYRQSVQASGSGSGVIRRARLLSQRWESMLDFKNTSLEKIISIDRIGVLLALAYPDRIAQRQPDGSRRYKLANGRLARFHQPDSLEHEEYLVIADLDGGHSTSKIYLAAPIRREDLVEYFPGLLHQQEFIGWNSTTQSVVAQRIRQLGELVLEERRLSAPDPGLVTAALLEGIRKAGVTCLPWTEEQRQWQARVLFLRRVSKPDADWPDVSDDILGQTLETWLAPYITGLTNLAQLKRIDLTWPLQAHLTETQRRTLNSLAPTRLLMPTGSRLLLDYQSGQMPVLAVRLQELFGMTETPLVANSTVPVLIHVLSPARRPVQVTQDLKSFWKTGYPEVKKELKGRYPKHFWPDDPLKALPTRGLKRR